jgi:hypothetical protein
MNLDIQTDKKVTLYETFKHNYRVKIGHLTGSLNDLVSKVESYKKIAENLKELNKIDPQSRYFTSQVDTRPDLKSINLNIAPVWCEQTWKVKDLLLLYNDIVEQSGLNYVKVSHELLNQI